MDRIFFFGRDTVEAHGIAERLGFGRGQYIVVIGGEDNRTRGLRGETMFVVGNAADRKDYNEVVCNALMNNFVVIYIDDEVLSLIEG
jgi:hypothetical protein